ncbi:regulatory protein, luxR family [Actinoplanes cyaneus]|nr:regulatory protein, luxR family [Actinoplanes cyaneus]
MIIATRPGGGTFTARVGVRQTYLRPLDRAASESLLRRDFPELAPDVAARVADDANGLPLALRELPAAMTSAERDGSQPLAPTLPLTARLLETFHRVPRDVPAAGRWVLLIAALDRTGDAGVLRSAAGFDIAALLAQLEAAGAIVETAAGHVHFSHPLIRSAVVALAGREQQRRAHQALAAALEHRPDRRAWHLAEASAAAGEPRASLMFERAAREIQRRGDVSEAVVALIRAAFLSDQPSERARLLTGAARIEADIRGDLTAATRLLDRAQLEDPHSGHTLPAVTAKAVLLLGEAGGVTAAHQQLVAALDRGGDAANDRALTEAVWMLFQICWFSGRPELWVPLRDLIARFAKRLPAYLRLIGPISAGPTEMTRADVQDLNTAVSGLTHELDPVVIVRTAFIADGAGRGSECQAAVRRVYQAGPSGGALVSVIFATVILSDSGFSSGDWDEAERLADDGLRLCNARDHLMFRWQLYYRRALLAALRGDSETARSMAGDMLEWAESRKLAAVEGRACHVLALDALGRRDTEAAYNYLERVVMTERTQNGAQMFAIDIIEASAGPARRVDVDGRSGPLAAFAKTLSSAVPSLVTTGAAAMSSDEESARALYENALSRPEAARFPFEQARVQLAFGSYLRRRQILVEARAMLNTALRTFRQLHAAPWVTRTIEELRASGERVPVNAAELAGLTQQQIQIAGMAAKGMTNRQIGAELFLSDRTVGGHLAVVFRKLRVTSRLGLQDVLGVGPL